ncbi:MAG: DUF5908 family protein [Leadbetterella sp.]
MPIQIHEVIIRLTVAERQDPCAKSPEVPASSGTSSGGGTGSNEQIAEQIFEILKAKKER